MATVPPDPETVQQIRRMAWTAVTVVVLILGYKVFPVVHVYTCARQQVRSPDRRYVASTVYGFDEHSIGIETAGWHPFGFGRETAYDLGEQHVNVTELKWQDNHTLLVRYYCLDPDYGYTTAQWHDVTLLFQRDTQHKVDPFARDDERYD